MALLSLSTAATVSGGNPKCEEKRSLFVRSQTLSISMLVYLIRRRPFRRHSSEENLESSSVAMVGLLRQPWGDKRNMKTAQETKTLQDCEPWEPHNYYSDTCVDDVFAVMAPEDSWEDVEPTPLQLQDLTRLIATRATQYCCTCLFWHHVKLTSPLFIRKIWYQIGYYWIPCRPREIVEAYLAEAGVSWLMCGGGGRGGYSTIQVSWSRVLGVGWKVWAWCWILDFGYLSVSNVSQKCQVWMSSKEE